MHLAMLGTCGQTTLAATLQTTAWGSKVFKKSISQQYCQLVVYYYRERATIVHFACYGRCGQQYTHYCFSMEQAPCVYSAATSLISIPLEPKKALRFSRVLMYTNRVFGTVECVLHGSMQRIHCNMHMLLWQPPFVCILRAVV